MKTSQAAVGAIALAVAGVLFVLYPAVRPWHDESTVDGAVASISSGAWVAAHLFAMLGFILVALGLLALRDTIGGGLAHAAVVTTWIGAGLTLPYYGAEDFGLHAIAEQYRDGQRFDLLGTVDAFRYHPVAVTLFAAGLLALAAGAVLAALAVRRSLVLPRASGVLFAVGFALFLPQFFTPAPVRIAHGVLLGAGCVWLAIALWRARPAPGRTH
ncbi:hypothetical protein [Phytohabitans rumicis]|uniref:hypothetical protein n=1 Tax=Phytohabitans rumicis TaxID=1076125 RepID=UPI0031E5CE6F